jgi:hypothetical protein
LKEEALAKTNPVKGAPKRFQPDDELLAFLKQLYPSVGLCRLLNGWRASNPIRGS